MLILNDPTGKPTLGLPTPGLTRRQAEVLGHLIRGHWRRRMPSYRELCKLMGGVCFSTVQRYLATLARKRWLVKPFKRGRAYDLNPDRLVFVPLGAAGASTQTPGVG